MIIKALLKDILTHYQPAYAGTWENWFSMELSQTTELLINSLKEEYAENGEFFSPIVISLGEYDEKTGAVIHPPCVLDGMHRIRALYELDEKYVLITNNYDYMDSPYSLSIEYIPGSQDYEELFEKLSFRYMDQNINTWINQNGSYGIGNIEHTILIGSDIEKASLENLFCVLNQICLEFDCKLIEIKVIKTNDNLDEIIIKSYSQ